MLIVKTNPVDIDSSIQFVQNVLHDTLIGKWGISSSAWNCYGRAYRNKKDKGYIAEVYEGNKEYKEVYWNDSLTMVSFFGLSNRPIDQKDTTASIHLIVFVDLDKLYPTIDHRADEEVRKDVYEAIGIASTGMIYQSTELGLENVLKEYPGLRRDNLETKVDMHPIHCFRINYNLIFEHTICNTPYFKNF